MAQYKSFTGLRNDRPQERLSDTDLSIATNVDIGNSGEVSMRNGSVVVNAGAEHSGWSDPDGKIAFYVAADKLYFVNPDLSGKLILSGLTLGLPMDFRYVNDRVYFSNGVQTGIYDINTGKVRSWGLVPPSLPSVSITVGNMPAGDYQFTMTYLRSDGQESGAPLCGTITLLGGSGLVFSLPVSSDPDVVSKIIYLSTPNGEVKFLALTVPNSQTSASYTNDTLELNYPLQTEFMLPAPAGHIVSYYRGRMYVCDGDTIYRSLPYAYELFDLRDYIQMDGRLAMLAPTEDKEGIEAEANDSGFFVATDKSFGVIVGSDKFMYVPKGDYGAIEGAFDYVDGSLYGDDSLGMRKVPMFLTTQGICVGMPKMGITNLTRSTFDFPAAGRGACLFRPGMNILIASCNY